MNPTTTDSGLPLWLQQVLPQWFVDRPVFTEGLYAGTVSMFYASAPIFGAVYGVALSEGNANTLSAFIAFIHANWFGLMMGYIFGGGIAGIRSKQAASKATEGTK